MSGRFILAQISDTHIRADDDGLSARQLERALAEAHEYRADVILLTGDLVNDERVDEYDLLARTIADVSRPLYLMPGNHDDRGRIREAFPRHGYLQHEGFLSFAIEDFSGAACRNRSDCAWRDTRPYHPGRRRMARPHAGSGAKQTDGCRTASPAVPHARYAVRQHRFVGLGTLRICDRTSPPGGAGDLRAPSPRGDRAGRPCAGDHRAIDVLGVRAGDVSGPKDRPENRRTARLDAPCAL